MSHLNQRLDFCDRDDCDHDSLANSLSDSQLVAQLPPALLLGYNIHQEATATNEATAPTHFMDMAEFCTPRLLSRILEDQRMCDEDKENISIKQEPFTPEIGEPELLEESQIPSYQPLQPNMMYGSRSLLVKNEFEWLDFAELPHPHSLTNYFDCCCGRNKVSVAVQTEPETPVSTRAPLQPRVLFAPNRGGLDMIEFPLDSNDDTIEWDDEDDICSAASIAQHSNPELDNYCDCHLTMTSSLPSTFKKFKKF
jgi:hypothetical protein